MRPPTRARRRVESATVVTLGQGAIAAISAISIVVTARALGAEGRGNVSTVQALIGLAVAVGVMGLPTLIVRQVLLPAPRMAVMALGSLSLVATCLVAGGLALGFLAFGGSVPDGAIPLMTLVVCGAILQVVSEAYAATLQSAQRFVRLAMSRLAWSGLSMMALAVTAVLANDAVAAVRVAVVVHGLVFIMTVMVNRDAWRTIDFVVHYFRTIRRLPSLRRLLHAVGTKEMRVALQSHLSLLLLLMVYRLDVLILGIASTASEVGVYTVAYAAAEIAWMYANGHSVTLISSIVRSADRKNQADLLLSATRRSVAATTAVGMLVVASGSWTIPLIFGEEFRGSYLAFLAIFPGVIAFVTFKLRVTVLIARGKPLPVALVCAILVTVNCVLTLMLAPAYGATGASISTSVTYVLGWLLILRAKE